MKPIYACLFYLCGVGVVSWAAAGSAERLSIGIGVGERNGIHQDWFEQNRFIYNVGDIGEVEDERDVFSGRSREHPSYLRRDQLPKNDGNDDLNLSDHGDNRRMTPSADVPNSVKGQSGAPNVVPDVRSEGDPAVRDLSGGGL
jgi:hypothetical protein